MIIGRGGKCVLHSPAREGEKNCVTHSLIMFRMVEYIVNPLGTGLPF